MKANRTTMTAEEYLKEKEIPDFSLDFKKLGAEKIYTMSEIIEEYHKSKTQKALEGMEDEIENYYKESFEDVSPHWVLKEIKKRFLQ